MSPDWVIVKRGRKIEKNWTKIIMFVLNCFQYDDDFWYILNYLAFSINLIWLDRSMKTKHAYTCISKTNMKTKTKSRPLKILVVNFSLLLSSLASMECLKKTEWRILVLSIYMQLQYVRLIITENKIHYLLLGIPVILDKFDKLVPWTVTNNTLCEMNWSFSYAYTAFKWWNSNLKRSFHLNPLALSF